MFRFLTLFPDLDADKDGGGSDAGTGAEGDKKAGANEDKPGSDAATGDDKKDRPEKTEDDKITIEDHKKLKAEYDALKTRVGKQGDELGKKAKTLKELQDKMKDDPEGFMEALAEATGKKVNFGKKTADPNKDLMSDDDDVRKAAMNKMTEEQKEAAMENRIMGRIKPTLKSIHDTDMANRYKDFDILADDRGQIEAKYNSGLIGREELFHKAAQADNMKKSLEAAKVEAVEEYVEQLRLKAEADTGTGGEGDPKKGAAKSSDMKDFVKAQLG